MKLHSLQYLRAFAALAVVYSHAVMQVPEYNQFLNDTGGFGVDIFFVISGFIMVYIAKPNDTPYAFMTNRIRRVVPLYWFFTLLMGSVLLIMPSVFKATVFEWDTLLLSLAFIPHWSVAHSGHVWPIVAPGWSLMFEMYFYLVFALSLLLAARYRIFFMSAVISVVFIIGSYFDNGESAIARFFALSIVFEFVLGMLLAIAWQRGFRLPSSTSWYLLMLAVSLLLLDIEVPRIIKYGIPSLLVVMACLFIRVKHYQWAVLLGDASYALYLSHIFVLGLLRKILPPVLGDGPMAAYLFVVLSLIICTLVSIPIHQYVDNWLLRKERLKFATGDTRVPRKA